MTTDGVRPRLVWPQWQGGGSPGVRELAPEFPFDVARRGYAIGSAVLATVLPAHGGPVAAAPVAMGDEGLEVRDGVEAKTVVVHQLGQALDIIRENDPARIVTLGGECAVSVAPFAEPARRYGDDLAIVWIDSHLDVGTPASEYPGFHAMAVSAPVGHGDADILAAFAPDDLRQSTDPLLNWLAGTGCSRVAIHFDVDTVDSNEIVFGLGAEPGGLTSAQVRRIVDDVTAQADVVGLTIAEFTPRQVIHLQQLLNGFPLLGPQATSG